MLNNKALVPMKYIREQRRDIVWKAVELLLEKAKEEKFNLTQPNLNIQLKIVIGENDSAD